MRILVLGASGQIGNAIVRELITQGHAVTGTGRSAAVPRNLESLDFNYSPGNIDTNGQLDEWIAGQDAVVDAAAPYSINLLTASNEAEKQPRQYATDRTDRLIRCLLKYRAKLLHISSALLQRPNETHPLSSIQSKLVRKLYPYFAVKEIIEERIIRATEQGLDAVIVRPTACIGPWEVKPREQCWIPNLLSGHIPTLLSHKTNVMDTRDLASAVAELISLQECHQIVTLAGHNTTTNELLAQLCTSGGVPAPQIGIPAALSIIPLIWAEAIWATIGRPSPMPSLVAALLCEQRWMEQSSMQKRILPKLRPISETAEDTIHWYRTIGYC